jgi:UDP-N-acetylglucosamine--dolichyl-phosphate N-acetylglucosaminephosphotransferase
MTTTSSLVVLGAAGGVTALVSYASARYLSTKFVKMGITGNDIHKPGRPLTAEMGGLSVLLGMLIGTSVVMIGSDDPMPPFLAGVVTVVGASLVGVFDDITAMRQRYKPFLVAVTAIPLMYVLWNRNSITVPLGGSLPLGIVYPLAVVPFAIVISSNFTNMLAGFNGLEAGCSTIALGALTFLAAVQGSYVAAGLGLILVCGFVGFLKLNWYPAKIFPGDTGTLMAGAGIAAIALLAGLEFAAIIVSIPAGIDFTLKMLARKPFGGRRSFGNTTVDEGGHLKPPSYPALVHAFMRSGPVTERGLVISVLGMEGVYAALAIAVTLLGWPLH